MVFMLMEHYGGAGHSCEIAKKLSDKGLLIGIDRDIQAIEAAKKKLSSFKNVKYIHGNHDDIKDILESLQIDKVDGILLDLGVSSFQLDEKSRGFSYIGSNALDMRMDSSQELTAKDVVNNYSEEKLSEIIFEYGEEKFAKNIAKNICKYRSEKDIETTDELVKIIEQSIPKSKQNNGHPAKRTFQAIRIEVNNELEPLKNTVLDSIDALKENGRLCIITFHSLEDRIVKRIFKEFSTVKNLETGGCEEKTLELVTKKPIYPTDEEIKENPPSRSAKLRIAKKL